MGAVPCEQVCLTPVVRQTDRHDWKITFQQTTYVGGNYSIRNPFIKSDTDTQIVRSVTRKTKVNYGSKNIECNRKFLGAQCKRFPVRVFSH